MSCDSSCEHNQWPGLLLTLITVTYLSNNDNNHISIDIVFIALSLILTVMTAPLFHFSTFLCCQRMGLSARKQDNCG